jgi:hypothetical protein
MAIEAVRGEARFYYDKSLTAHVFEWQRQKKGLGDVRQLA